MNTLRQLFRNVNLTVNNPRNLGAPYSRFDQIICDDGDIVTHVQDLCALRIALKILSREVVGLLKKTKANTDDYRDERSRFRAECRGFHDDKLFSLDGMTPDRLARAFDILYARLNLMFVAEKLLIDKEMKHKSGKADMQFEASLIRAERAQYRSLFNTRLADLHTESIRQLFAFRRSEEPVECVARPYNESDEECGICSEGFGDQTDPPAITYRCCSHPFHANCLLTWLISNTRNGTMTCPMCRHNMLHKKFISELMEMRIQQLNIL